MHDHDSDLVAALAEESLPVAEAASAEAGISSCPRCSADLATQRLAVTSARMLSGASMSSSERGDLRAAVADAINLDLAPEPGSRRKHRRAIPWPSVAIAAASVLAVVAIVPLIGTLSTTGSDDSASRVELALTTSTVAFDDERIAASESLPVAEEDTALGTSDDGLDGAQAAPTTDTQPAGADAPVTTTTSATSGIVERVGDGDLKSIFDNAADVIAIASPAPGPCDIEASEHFETFEGVLTAPVPLGDSDGVAYLTSSDGVSIDRLVVFDRLTCEAFGDIG